MKHAYDSSRGGIRSILPNRSGKAAPIILGVIVLAAIGVAVWWFAFRKGGGEASKLASNYIPKDVQVVGGFDAAEFYNSAIYKELGPEIEKKLADDKQFQEMTTKAGFDYKKVEAVAFGVSNISGMMGRSGEEKAPPKFVAAVKGTFDSAKMMTFLKESAGSKAEEKDLEGVKAIVAGNEGAVGMLGDDVLLAASPDWFATSVKLSKGTGDSVEKNADLAGIRGHIDDGATFWVAAALPKEAMEAAPGGEMFAKASFAAFSVDLSSGIDLKSAIKMGSGDDANKASSQIKMGIGLASGFAASVPDIGETLKKLVEGVKVEVDGDVLKVTASASSDDVKKLIEAGKKQGMMKELMSM
jgi:hypothetical protein